MGQPPSGPSHPLPIARGPPSPLGEMQEHVVGQKTRSGVLVSEFASERLQRRPPWRWNCRSCTRFALAGTARIRRVPVDVVRALRHPVFETPWRIRDIEVTRVLRAPEEVIRDTGFDRIRTDVYRRLREEATSPSAERIMVLPRSIANRSIANRSCPAATEHARHLSARRRSGFAVVLLCFLCLRAGSSWAHEGAGEISVVADDSRGRSIDLLVEVTYALDEHPANPRSVTATVRDPDGEIRLEADVRATEEPGRLRVSAVLSPDTRGDGRWVVEISTSFPPAELEHEVSFGDEPRDATPISTLGLTVSLTLLSGVFLILASRRLRRRSPDSAAGNETPRPPPRPR